MDAPGFLGFRPRGSGDGALSIERRASIGRSEVFIGARLGRSKNSALSPSLSARGWAPPKAGFK
jgi:hypothetical protein